MALNISEPFIRYPIATSLLMVGLLFVGIVAYPNLPVAPLPQVDFPTLQVSAQLPGASPETMASSVAQPLETQFAQIPGVSQMTSVSTLGSTAITLAVRPQPQHRRRGERRAGGDQRGRRAIAEEPADPADLQESQSGRFADPAALGEFAIAAADRGRRPSLDQARPADQPDPRRRAGHDRRPADARHPHSARSGQTRRQESVARGGARAALDRDRRRSQGHDLQRRTARSRSTPTISSPTPRPGTTSSSPIATTDRCASATSARRSRDRRTRRRRHGPTASAPCSWSSTSSPAPTSSTPSTRSWPSCRASRRRCRLRSTSAS